MSKLVIINLLLLMPLPFFGQVSGDLSGRVIDVKNNEPIFGASIVLQGTSLGAITDESGYFRIESVPVQTYNLEISYLGYQTKTIFNIIVKSVGNPPLIVALTEQIEILDQVVVESNPFARPIETPISSQSFSAVEIETYPGGNSDITSVIQSMPGVSPSVGGFRNDLIIRGGAPNETVYYLDDIEIPNLNHFSTQGSAGGPVGLVNISFVDEVTLSSSSFGAEFDNPLSAVLQFRQRDGNFEQFGGNIRIGASEAGITFEGPIIKNKKNSLDSSTFMFSVRRSYLQFVFELIGLPIRPDYWDFQWKLIHQIDRYNSLSFIGIGSIDDFTLETSDEFDEQNQVIIEQSPIIQQRTITVGLSWRKNNKNSDGYMVTALSSNKLENLYSRYTDNINLKDPTFINDSYEWETKLRWKKVQFINGWKTELGLNAQYSDYYNLTEVKFRSFDYLSTLNLFKYGFYGKLSRSLFRNRLDLSLGIRTDVDTFSTGSSLGNNISPRIALSYTLSRDQKTKLITTVGRYFKMPLYTSLGFQDQVGNHVNKTAKYTRSDHYVVGIEHNPNEATRVALEGFLKQYSDYPISTLDQISLANKGGGFEVLGNEPLTFDGRGKTYGIELQYQRKLFKNFYGILSYTYFYSTFSNADGELRPSIWDNRHLVSFNGGLKLKRNWELSWRWRFAGRTPFIPFDPIASLSSYPELIIDYPNVGKESLGSFNVADIRVDKKWNFRWASIGLFLEVQNFLVSVVPTPDTLTYDRSETGELNLPLQLIPLSTSEDGGTPIPSIGLVLYF